MAEHGAKGRIEGFIRLDEGGQEITVEKIRPIAFLRWLVLIRR